MFASMKTVAVVALRSCARPAMPSSYRRGHLRTGLNLFLSLEECGALRADASLFAADRLLRFGQFARLLKRFPSERCPSGLRSTLGKRVLGKLNRGFESHPLRHNRYSDIARPFLLVLTVEIRNYPGVS